MALTPVDKDEMDIRDLKRQLMLAQRTAFCAAGVNANGAFIVISTKAPALCKKELIDEYGKMNTYWMGKARIDSNERTRLILEFDRPGGGLSRKLARALKGAGVKSVAIVVPGQQTEEDAG